ncbi:MAG TPA: nucleotide exchange factor GrpE [Candidatus Angelobacter sp.]|jgi:molecular chaperone GrpE|nr:nucleotide exchange factor GrpE [Candidatus Angelobacter sp.]
MNPENEKNKISGSSPDKKKIDYEKHMEKIKEEKDKFIRLFAEFENYKKRTQKERFELFKTAHQNLIIDLLPVLDDFERGINEIKQSKGIMLISEKFIKVLQENGLRKIEIKKGDNLNTDLHEVITQVQAPKEYSMKIVEIIEAGYMMENKVIRHAKVVVGK